MDARRLVAGDVAVLSRPAGEWAACLVTAVSAGEIGVCALDRWTAHPPSLADLAEAEPLWVDHHSPRRRPAHHTLQTAEAVPPGLEWIGRLPVPAGVRDWPNSHASWPVLADDLVQQRAWDRLDPSVREAYRAVGNGPDYTTVDLGAGPATMDPRRTTDLDLTDGPLPVPTTGAPRWSTLDRLPRCTALTWRGADRGLTAALLSRPLITRLTWIDPPDTVDLSDTAVLDLTSRGRLPAELRLPPQCRSLALAPEPAPNRRSVVIAAAAGRWLALSLSVTDDHVDGGDPVAGIGLPDGLDAVREVLIRAAGTASVAALTSLTELEQVTVLFERPPGRLVGAAALAGPTGLRTMVINDGYALDAGTLPDLPALTHLEINGIRRSAATGLRARYRSSGTRLLLSGAKADLWLAANLDNPFRDWADDDARAGAAACRSYADALRAVTKLPATALDRPDQAVAILRTMIERLNQVDAKYDIIDTIRREEACDAFAGLAARAGIAPDEATALCDAWRDW